MKVIKKNSSFYRERGKIFAKNMKVKSRPFFKAFVIVLCVIFAIAFTVVYVKNIPTCFHTVNSRSFYGHYHYGAVASDAPVCSQVGNEIMMKNKGNAADALIATMICNGAINIQSSGFGGGFFALCYNTSSNSSFGVDAREIAPKYSNMNMFDDNSNQEKMFSYEAIGVPMDMKGLLRLYELSGSIPWRDLVQGTIDIIEDGTPIFTPLDLTLQKGQFFRDIVRTNISWVLRFKDLVINPIRRKYWRYGDYLQRNEFLKTLQEFRDNPYGVYSSKAGSLNDKITSDMQAAGMNITMEEMNSYKPLDVKPIAVPLRFVHKKQNWTQYYMHVMPPPSSGLIIGFITNIMANFKYKDDKILKNCGEAARYFHRLVESLKFANSHKNRLGDIKFDKDGFIRKLMEKLQQPEYAEEFFNLIENERTFESEYYDIETAGTSHISVYDKNGLGCSATSSINTHFGSLWIGPKTGILFNNHMHDFSRPFNDLYEDFKPNPRNFIESGKKPMSSMAPLIVTDAKSSNIRLIIGATGGSRLISALASVVYMNLYMGINLKTAIDMPRVHHQQFPNNIQTEDSFSEDVEKRLLDMGHDVNENKMMSTGVTGIEVSLEKGGFTTLDHGRYKIRANTDFRKQASVAGY